MASKYDLSNDKMDAMIADSNIFKGDVSLIELMKVNHELELDKAELAAGGFIKKVTTDGDKTEKIWVTWKD
jgi:hypothetical protein